MDIDAMQIRLKKAEDRLDKAEAELERLRGLVVPLELKDDGPEDRPNKDEAEIKEEQ